MERNVGAKNLQLMRSLLQKQYEVEIAKLKDGGNFTYNFSKEKPYFELVLRVDERDFTTRVMESEMSALRQENQQLRATIKTLGGDVPKPNWHGLAHFHEDISTHGDDVISHQFKEEYGVCWHRLLKCKAPHEHGEWVPIDQTANFKDFTANADEVTKLPF